MNGAHCPWVEGGEKKSDDAIWNSNLPGVSLLVLARRSARRPSSRKPRNTLKFHYFTAKATVVFVYCGSSPFFFRVSFFSSPFCSDNTGSNENEESFLPSYDKAPLSRAWSDFIFNPATVIDGTMIKQFFLRAHLAPPLLITRRLNLDCFIFLRNPFSIDVVSENIDVFAK